MTLPFQSTHVRSGIIALIVAATVALAAGRSGGAAQEAGEKAAAHHQAGVAFHLQRRLDEASREYARALALEPPRHLTTEEWQLIRRFVPRLYVVAGEFFPLKDFAAILHPSRRLIAYHFFWEDDIDFPEDNDPCDHELVWVEYAEDRRTLVRLRTYFHGHILDGGEAAVAEARRHAMRPRVNVQWGKHGSMPTAWESLTIRRDAGPPDAAPITLKRYNEETFRKLSGEGRRLPDHPLGVRDRWPRKFAGDWAAFIRFSRPLEPLRLLEQRRMAAVSRWNSATINQHFLRYNFRPKTEWPPD